MRYSISLLALAVLADQVGAQLVCPDGLCPRPGLSVSVTRTPRFSPAAAYFQPSPAVSYYGAPAAIGATAPVLVGNGCNGGAGQFFAPPAVYEQRGYPPGFFPYAAPPAGPVAPPASAYSAPDGYAAVAAELARINERLAVLESRR